MPNRPSDVPAEIVLQLEAGTLETANLAEGLAFDFGKLMRAAVPHLAAEIYDALDSHAERGVTRRMEACGQVLLDHIGLDHLDAYQKHASDTVRGWVCFAIGLAPDLKLSERLKRIRPLAEDTHFGVREWAWLPLRPHLSKNVTHTISELKSWTSEKSPFLRRFASESTRPRGVWSVHIAQLKQNPSLGLPILEPLRADANGYVQDSVSNWLNDASKTQQGWVKSLCERWLSESNSEHTQRICRRALRTSKAE
jgi:3-methyladenine DNA glycosylase AlkC